MVGVSTFPVRRNVRSMSSPARAMDFYSCDGKVVRRDEGECFGWWLSDLTPGAPPRAVFELRLESATDSEDSEDSELCTLLDGEQPAALQSLSLMQCLSPSSEELARLVDRSSPTHRHLDAVLKVTVRDQALLQKEKSEPSRRVHIGWRGGDWEHSPRKRELCRSSNELETAMHILQGKLRTVEDNNRQLMLDIDSIHRDFQTAIVTTTRLTKAARSLAEELQDVRYLDELIFMMEGHLDRISLRVWPFTTAHVSLGPDTCEEYNLVV